MSFCLLDDYRSNAGRQRQFAVPALSHLADASPAERDT